MVDNKYKNSGILKTQGKNVIFTVSTAKIYRVKKRENES